MPDTKDTTTRKPIITRETVVPIGIVVAVIAVAVVSAWNVSGALSTNDANSQHRFEKIEKGMTDLKKSIEALNHDQFSREEMAMWVQLLKARNPDLNIPEVKNE